MDVKKPTTYEEQLNKLKERGCIVEDEKQALEVLKNVNYYRLTAYFLSFQKTDKTYFEGTTFENVYNVYEFDRKLRNLIFSVLEEIEILLRTRLAYYFSHKYGALGYMDKTNLGNSFDKERFDDLCDELVKHNEAKLFVKHHIYKYEGKFPLWVLVELMSFGNLSLFYADMTRADKKEFAKTVFGTYDNNLQSWLLCLTDLRNSCAHYARLYNTKMRAEPRTPNGYCKLGKTVFDYIQIVKFLYPNIEKWNVCFVSKLSSLIQEYAEYIDLKHIGFPEDWASILTNEINNKEKCLSK